jgi:hypothetical protein
MPNTFLATALIDPEKAFVPGVPFPKLVPKGSKLTIDKLGEAFGLDSKNKDHLNRHIGLDSDYPYKEDLHNALSSLVHVLTSNKLTDAEKENIQLLIKPALISACTQDVLVLTNQCLHKLPITELSIEDLSRLFELKPEEVTHLNRHIGADSTYTEKKGLLEALSQLGHGLESDELNQDQKNDIRSMIKSGLPTCTEGLLDRAKMSLRLLSRPVTIDQLLPDLRSRILTGACQAFLFESTRVGSAGRSKVNPGNEVHVAQSFLRVARENGLGIYEKFIHEQKILGGVGNETIKEVISAAFRREYTPAYIVEALFDSAFAELGYYGVNHDQTGYAAPSYVAFVEFFTNALGIKITDENTGTLYGNFIEWQKAEKAEKADEDDEDDEEYSRIARGINKKYVISQLIEYFFKTGFFVEDLLTKKITLLSDSEAPAGGASSSVSATRRDALELSFNPQDPTTLLFKLNKDGQTALFFLENAKHFKSDLNTFRSLEKNILSCTELTQDQVEPVKCCKFEMNRQY